MTTIEELLLLAKIYPEQGVLLKKAAAELEALDKERDALKENLKQLRQFAQNENTLAIELQKLLTAEKEASGRMRKLLPTPSNEGLRFGDNFWISFDKLCGWQGQNEYEREKFLSQSVIAQAFLNWLEQLKQALSTPPAHVAISDNAKEQV